MRQFVIPAKAGIQGDGTEPAHVGLDARLRGHDGTDQANGG